MNPDPMRDVFDMFRAWALARNKSASWAADDDARGSPTGAADEKQRMLELYLAVVNGGYRYLGRWAEISAKRYPEFVRMLASMNADPAAQAGGAGANMDSVRAFLREMIELPIEEAKRLQAEIGAIMGGGKPASDAPKPPPAQPRRTKAPATATQPSFDYIIVGAGSAGCTLAYRLSQKARVLLLEAGGPDTQACIHEPTGVLQAIFADPRVSRPYMTAAQAHLGNRQVDINRGIVRGGCSSINGMVYIRGNRRDYDHWTELGNEGWSYEDVLPYFKRSEHYAEGASKYHGADGPLDVCRLPGPSPVAQAFIAAAANLPAFRQSRADFDFNGPQQQNGAGLYCVTVTPDFKRASAAVAFLDSVSQRETLQVMTNAKATGIVIENGRAVGVRCQVNGREQVFRADREIVLSAGVFESPRLLMLSGIGPADELKKLGITPVADLPGVGQNLHDHMMMLTYWLAKKPTGASRFLAEAGLFTNARDLSAESPPDLQYHFLAGMVGLAVDPLTEPNFLFCPTLCHPQSRGDLRLGSTDPNDPLIIRPNYLERDADIDVLVKGLELARELAHTSPLDEFRKNNAPFAGAPGGPRLPVPQGGAAELRQFVAATATTVWHPVGTCKMGRDELAVVDPQLRVYGVPGLRVADASIMPTIPRGNINAPCIMIGERAADLIRRS
jgi:choline dehydrogenase